MQRKPLDVWIFASDAAVQEAVTRAVEADSCCRVMAKTCNAQAVQGEVPTQPHDVIIIAGEISKTRVLEFVRIYRLSHPGTHMIVSHLTPEISVLRQLRKSGVSSFLGNDARPDEFLAAINAARARGVYVSSSLADSLFLEHQMPGKTENRYRLTEREIEILALLANGLCNKEIANRFDLSVRTVETHRLNIRRKTTSNTLSDLVRIAGSLGITQQSEAALSASASTTRSD